MQSNEKGRRRVSARRAYEQRRLPSHKTYASASTAAVFVVMVSPVKDMTAHVDPNFQHQLYELARLANVQIDHRLFRWVSVAPMHKLTAPPLLSVIVDLLRNGVSPDSIYAFLVKASKRSKLGQRIREKEENEERERLRQRSAQNADDENRSSSK